MPCRVESCSQSVEKSVTVKRDAALQNVRGELCACPLMQVARPCVVSPVQNKKQAAAGFKEVPVGDQGNLGKRAATQLCGWQTNTEEESRAGKVRQGHNSV
jgi:hypothetical protein